MLKKVLALLSMIVFALVLSACADTTDSASDSGDGRKLHIYTTIYPIQYFAERIGGDHAEVESILPAGSDAHSFEPTSNLMVDIAEGDAFIYSSDDMETYAAAIADAIGEDEVTITQTSKGIDMISFSEAHTHEEEAEHEHSDEEAGHEHSDEEAEHEHSDEEAGHHHGSTDPHYWLDPVRAEQMAANIRDTLTDIDPDHKDIFEENYQAVAEELSALDEEFKQVIEGKENKKIIVSHAAYGYWEEEYGIEQIAISGLSPSNEPSQQQLTDIIHTAEENQLNYVMFEQNISPKVATVVQEEIDADVLRIHNLATRTEEEVESGEDYFSIMKKNLEQLDIALTNK